VLGRRIMREIGCGDQPQCGTDVDDPARTTLSHRRQHRVDHAHHPKEVHIEQRLHLLDRGFFGCTHQAETGIIDDKVNLPGFCQDVRD